MPFPIRQAQRAPKGASNYRQLSKKHELIGIDDCKTQFYYAAMVEHLGRGVGRILDQLKKKGIDQNTLVIFLSDDGACAEVIEPGCSLGE